MLHPPETWPFWFFRSYYIILLSVLQEVSEKITCWLQAGRKAIKSKGMVSRCAWGSSFALCLNPKNEKRHLIPSQVVKTELGGIWRKITADERTPKRPCFQGFSHLFALKMQWKSESESLLRFRRVLTDFRKSLLEFLIEPSDFSPKNHAFDSA